MNDDVSSGVKLIASHLAQVKLEAAEREYADRLRIARLEASLKATKDQLEAGQKDIHNYQTQIKTLQSENTYKALVAEREKWKQLIDTLRKDKADLRAEVESLKEEIINKLQDRHQRNSVDETGGVSVPDTEVGDVVNCENLNPALSPKLGWGQAGKPDAYDLPAGMAAIQAQRKDSLMLGGKSAMDWIQLQGELKYLRHQVELRDTEIRALRTKLDQELELKWERDHQNVGWKRSLLESFAEVLAPYPSSPPPSPKQQVKGRNPDVSIPGGDRVMLTKSF